MCRRRFEREKLGFIGVPEVWGASPRGHDAAGYVYHCFICVCITYIRHAVFVRFLQVVCFFLIYVFEKYINHINIIFYSSVVCANITTLQATQKLCIIPAYRCFLVYICYYHESFPFRSDHDGSGTKRRHADSSTDSSDTNKKKKKKKGKSKSRKHKHKHRKHKKDKSKYVENFSSFLFGDTWLIATNITLSTYIIC